MPEGVRDPASHAEAATALAEFRAAYAASLREPRGWWSVSGLAFVAERVDCGAEAEIALPERYAAKVATWWRSGDHAVVEGAVWRDGVRQRGAVALAEGEAVRFGAEDDDVEALVMRRAERLALRLFDPRQGRQRSEAEVAWYEVSAGYVVPARLEPALAGETIPVVNMLGFVTDTPLAGTLRFTLQGVDVALLATRKPDGGLFVHFRDATSGPETYGAGRFLSVAAGDGERTVIDFHRATQPPCFHTPFATCPMPPLANRLPLAVRAGERTPNETLPA
jgi:uncharacterized protein